MSGISSRLHDRRRHRGGRQGTGRRRRAVTGALLTAALVIGVIAPASASTGRRLTARPAATAYTYDNKPAAKDFTPEKDYSYNSSGGAVGITRSAVGHYQVMFLGLGPEARGGTVDVTPEGNNSSAAECTVVGWGPDSSGADLTVGVDCFTLAGAALNTYFMAAFTSGGTGGVTGSVLDYVLANNDSAASYTPATAHQFNSRGGTNTISRSGAGRYVVSLPGPVKPNGTVKVTAYGAAPGSCEVVSWSDQSPGQHVAVDCYNAADVLTNREFTMTFETYDDLVGDGSPSGYAWANDPTASSYTPASGYHNSTAGQSVTVDRFGVGQWVVAFPGAGDGDSGDEQATAYGTGNDHCIVDGPGGGVGGQESADVYCFDPSGAPVDTPFTMQWWNM